MKKIIYFVFFVSSLFILTSCSCKHEELSVATCDKSSVCKDCGESVGEPTYEHLWIEATCYEPKTCEICGETEGEKIPEHTWIQADCENPTRCQTCDDIDGEPLGHNWTEATYDAPKTCSVCQKTEGSAMVKPPFLATLKNKLPLTITNYYSTGKKWNSVYLTEVRIEYEKNYSGANNIILYFSGEKTYDENGLGQSRSCFVGIKVYDKDGYVVASDTYYTNDLRVGDRFKNDKLEIYEDLPDGEYFIELLSTN